MELLAEIFDRTVGASPRKVLKWRVRRSSRVVLLTENGEVVLVYSRKFGYHKLPGGGIEGPESMEDAAKRETLEETGYKMTMDRALGAIIEYRSRVKLLQISYCFLCHTAGRPDQPKFTGKEEAERYKPVLAKDIDHAIGLVRKSRQLPYLAKFMVEREAAILQRAREAVS
jgi:ADP-ribose pyrophosphatase YjhB (NUDIX family)